MAAWRILLNQRFLNVHHPKSLLALRRKPRASPSATQQRQEISLGPPRPETRPHLQHISCLPSLLGAVSSPSSFVIYRIPSHSFEMVHLASLALAVLPWVAASPAVLGRGSSVSCGVRGYDQGTQAYVYKFSSSLATVAKCGALCRSRSKCKSFAIGEGTCLLYKVTV